MFCPQCGHKSQLDEQKFCHNCGFDLSKVGNSEPTELKKMIDFALKGQPSDPKERNEAQEPMSASSTETQPNLPGFPANEKAPAHDVTPSASSPSLKQPFWKKLNRTQLKIIIIGGLVIVGLFITAMINPLDANTAGLLAFAITVLGITFLVACLMKTRVNNQVKAVWGWGWYILLGFMYKSTDKTFESYGDSKTFYQLFALTVALGLYFTLRDKYRPKVQLLEVSPDAWAKRLWVYSFVSGLIAFFVALILAVSVSAFTNQIISSALDNKLSVDLKTNAELLSRAAEEFGKNDSKLWSQFSANPNTESELQSNIAIVESSRKLNHTKDSICVSALQQMQTAVKKASGSFSPIKDRLPFSPNDLQTLIEKAQRLSTTHYNMLTNLLMYYKATSNSSEDAHPYWQAYEDAKEKADQATNEYAVIHKKVFGQNIFDLMNQFQQKYYK